MSTTLSIAASNAAQLEGNSGSKPFTFTVNRTGDLSGASSVQWRVAGVGTNPAVASDFLDGVLPSGTVTFGAGDSQRIVYVYVSGDEVVEYDERFSVLLYSSIGATIGTSTAIGTILSDDLPSISLSLSQASVTEDGSNNLDYMFTRTGPTATPLTINYIVRGTASSDDYASLPAGNIKSITFAANESSVILAVDPTADTLVEEDETVEISLSPTTFYTIATPAAVVGRIINDDTSLAISPPVISQQEGNSGKTFYTFTVTRSGLLSGSSTAQWSVAGIGVHPADADDFGGSFPTDTVTFAAGETSKTITIEVSGDTIAESDETFAVILSDPTGATITTASAEGVIVNDDTNLAITPPCISQPEGDSGVTLYTFTVTRTGLLSGSSSVNWRVEGGIGDKLGANIFPADQDDISGLPYFGTIYFAAGQTSKEITVGVNGDTIAEEDEKFAVILSDAIGGIITEDTGIGVIVNDDTNLAIAPPIISQQEGNSGKTFYTFTVTRAGLLSGSSTAQWSVAGIGVHPADADDFGGSFPTGTVTFAKDDTSKTITIEVTGDTIAENDETFAVILSDPTGATITTASAEGVIVNDDTNLGIIAINANQVEGNSGSKSFTFAIQRTGVLSGTSTTSWAAAGSGITPADASDFAGGILPSDTVTFAPGEAIKLISVDINGDTQIETDETFSVTLYDSSELTPLNPTATGTIITDEPITISLSVQPSNVAEDGGQALSYTFTRNGPTDAPLTINFLISGSADPASDYTANCDLTNFPIGTITFNAGETDAILEIRPVADIINEYDETVGIELLASSEYAVGTLGPVVASIIDDDSPLINELCGDAGFGKNVLYRNDDASSQWIDLSEVFPGYINFENAIYYGFYINNNGNITFEGPSSADTLNLISSSIPRIAPFFADVDTRGGSIPTPAGGKSTGSNRVYWDINKSKNQIIVTWDDVGYFYKNVSQTNSFQLVLKNTGDNALGIEFRYEDINWLAGESSGGSIARAGYSLGVNNRYELPESGSNLMLNLVRESNVSEPGVYEFSPTVNQDSIIRLSLDKKFIYEDQPEPATYTFSRLGRIQNELYVSFSIGGTASFGSDYLIDGATLLTPASGFIYFAPGQDEADVIVNPISDTFAENDETISITLAEGIGYIRESTKSLISTIYDDEPTLKITPDLVSSYEGTTQTFTVTRDKGLDVDLYVDYYVENAWSEYVDIDRLGWMNGQPRWVISDPGILLDGINGNDFVGGMLPSGTIKIAAGSPSATIAIGIQADPFVEYNEFYYVRLKNSANAIVQPDTKALGKILNDDYRIIGGDIHVSTHDGLDYSFQNSGVYTLTKSSSGDLDVALFLDWQDPEKTVSIITAIAIKIDNHFFYFDTQINDSFLIDGIEGGESLESGTTMFLDTLEITRDGNNYTFVSQTTDVIEVIDNNTYLDISFNLNPGRARDLSGLMGDNDGNPANDAQGSWTSSAVEVSESPFAPFIRPGDYVPKAEQASVTRTINDVPQKYRDAVRSILDNAEKKSIRPVSLLNRVDQVSLDAWFSGGGFNFGSVDAAIIDLPNNPFLQNFIVYVTNADILVISDPFVPCFMAGTQIATPEGERGVQYLKPGDLVLTPDGPKAIKFLGRTTRKVEDLIAQEKMPVRISKDAFGPQLPSMDTYCTPSHAFVVDDCLVEARALVNNDSIIKIEKWPDIVPIIYFSIELDEHQLVWANGLLTETYYSNWTSTGFSREGWDNYPTYLELYQESKPMNELPMARIPFARQLPLRIREQLSLATGFDDSSQSYGDSQGELCFAL